MRILLALPVLLACGSTVLAQLPSGKSPPIKVVVPPPKTNSPTNPTSQQPDPKHVPKASLAPPLKMETAPPVTAPAALPASKELLQFDNKQAQVRWNSGRWELHAGNVWLKDFGSRSRDAEEALNVIRRLQLTQRGTIGYPDPIMEYWLADGKAPHAFGSGFRLFPIDQSTLRVEQIQGHWCVRDDRRLLFNFGSRQEDAQQAVNVIRGHNFNQIGYVGYPQPTMIYFLGGRPGSGVGASLQPPKLAPISIAKNDKAVSPGANQTGDAKDSKAPTDMNPALLQQAQMMAKGMQQLSAPPLGAVTHIRFNPREAAVRKDSKDWKLYAGQHVLASFGDSQQARAALQMLQHYNCNEHCLVGAPTTSFSYFLASGHAPFGMHPKLEGRPFQPEKITARQHQGSWYVCEDNKTLLFFGDRRDDAQAVTEAIKKHRFNFISQMGPADRPGMSLLVRTK